MVKIAVFASPMFLCACAHLPESPVGSDVFVSDVVLAVQCELANGYLQAGYPTVLDSFAAAVQLDLKVTDKAVSGAAFNWAAPVNAIGWKVHVGGGGEDQSYRYQKLMFQVRLDELKTKFPKITSTGKIFDACNSGNTGFSSAQTTLGLADWVGAAIKAVGSSQDASSVKELGYMINFDLKRNADGSVGVSTTRFASTGFSGSFENHKEHTLNVTIAPIKDYKPWKVPGAAESNLGKTRNIKKRAIPEETQQILREQLRQNRLDSIISPTQRGTLILQ